MPYLLTQALADEANVCAGTVRDYCRQGHLNPIRDSSGRRLFTQADVNKVRRIYLENTARMPAGRRLGRETHGIQPDSDVNS
jgi:predicted site-specific integrase-resolvase